MDTGNIESKILQALQQVRYPGTGKDIVTMGIYGNDLQIDGKSVKFSLQFKKQRDPFARSLVKACESAILTFVSPELEVKGNITAVFAEAPAEETSLPFVLDAKNIIAVVSGKGGVGKSTVAANTAVALARMGYRVGLLDADIFGPSIAKMFGVEDRQPMLRTDGERDLILPIQQYGVKLLSISFFVNKGSALIWRGAMAGNALRQLLSEADWGALDYFIIDFPPGTSDIHLTIVQSIAVTGAVVVSTPQEVALADARKAIDMFQNSKVKVPLLGIVENMAWFTPAELPHNRYYIFGKDGAKKLAETAQTELLAQIPLVQSVCESGDSGQPAALNEHTATGQAFTQLAHNLVKAVDERNRNLPPTERVKIK